MKNKYEMLLEWSNEVLAEESASYDGIEEKASKYLSALTVALAFFAFVARSMVAALNLVPPTCAAEWIILVSTGAVLVSIVLAWYLVFTVLKIHVVVVRPLDDELVQFFHSHAAVDVYFALARGNARALAENREKTDQKASRLRWAYTAIVTAAGLAVLLAIEYVVYLWV